MANVNYPYRAGEPSQMETQLAALATDPSRSGMAMALLPGAASIRQDVGQAAGDQTAREYALQVLTQRQTAQNQNNESRLKALALSQPGMIEAATQTPGLSDLFQGMSPRGTSLVQAGTAGAFDAQNAKTQLERMQGYESGVKSGYTVPPSIATEQTGIPFNMQAPEQEKIAGMHIAAANARANATALQAKFPNLSYTPGTGITGGNIRPENAVETAQAIDRLNEQLKSGRGTDAGGQPAVAQPSQQVQVPGSTVNKKTGQTVGQIRSGSNTAAMGANLPMAKTEGSAAPDVTTPSAGSVFTPVATNDAQGPDISHRQQLFQQYVANQKAAGRNPQDADRLINGNRLTVVRDSRTGQLWVAENGKPVAPLNPKRR